MRWLREHGLVSDYWQYDQLPLNVLADCRLLMEAEEQARLIAEARGG